MRKIFSIFILAILFLSFVAKPVHADATFAFVDGSYTKNWESLTHDMADFWKNLPLDFNQSGSDPDLYEAHGEATASDINGQAQHSVTGSVTATYNAQTGILQGEYQLIHTETIVPPSARFSNYAGVTTSEFSGTFENKLNPRDKTITIHYAGAWQQSVTGTPYGHEPDPNQFFTDTWEFPVDYQIAGTIPGRSCNPEVMGLEDLKPGDTLSPDATYFDINGDEVDVKQERWFINGDETPSIDWDGSAATLELQWTCLDGSAYTASYNVAAYTGPVITAAPTNPPLPPGTDRDQSSSVNQSPDASHDLTPLSIFILMAGGFGVLAILGLLGYLAFKPKKIPILLPPVIPPAAPPIPAQVPPQIPDNPSASVFPSPAFTPTLTPPPLTMQPAVPPQATPPPPPSAIHISDADRAGLTNIRDQMIHERDHIKDQWRQTRDAVEKLRTLKKKDMIKFIFKQGIEVDDWIRSSPIEMINKIAIDPLMEKAFQKHDSSQDPNIIVTINNRIESLQSAMKDLVNQSKYLNSEIAKIDGKLADHGEK